MLTGWLLGQSKKEDRSYSNQSRLSSCFVHLWLVFSDWQNRPLVDDLLGVVVFAFHGATPGKFWPVEGISQNDWFSFWGPPQLRANAAADPRPPAFPFSPPPRRCP